MKEKLLLTLALSVVSSFALASAPVQPSFAADVAAQAQEVGQKASNFSLPDADGKKHSLSDYKGKFIVLEWVNFGCPFVRKHYDTNNMQKLQGEYTGKGVVWLSICSSAKGKPGYFEGDDLKKEVAKNGSKATAYLVDADGAVGKQYGAKSTPDMIVIDKDQKIVYAGAIDDKPTTDHEDVKTAKNFVKEALDSAMKGKAVAIVSQKSYGCSVKYAD